MESLVSQGLSLMFYGMGFVFVFLTALVFITTAMSQCVIRFSSEDVVSTSNEPVINNTATMPDQKTMAAIAAAVEQYRQKKSN